MHFGEKRKPDHLDHPLAPLLMCITTRDPSLSLSPILFIPSFLPFVRPSVRPLFLSCPRSDSHPPFIISRGRGLQALIVYLIQMVSIYISLWGAIVFYQFLTARPPEMPRWNEFIPHITKVVLQERARVPTLGMTNVSIYNGFLRPQRRQQPKNLG